MSSLRFAIVVACLLTNAAIASPTIPKDGVEYVILSTPQPVAAAGKKIEVI